MSNVVKFVSRNVNTLWAPTKKTKANWRFGSTPNVVPFHNVEAVRQTQYEADQKIKYAEFEAKRDKEYREFLALPKKRLKELDAMITKLNSYEPTEDTLHDLYADCLNDSVPEDLDKLLSNSYHTDAALSDFIDNAKCHGWSSNEIRQTIVDCSEVSYGDMHNEDNQIACVEVGEYEDQIDDIDLKSLTTAERRYIRQRAQAYIPDTGSCVYWNTGAFFRLIVDCDALPKKLKHKRA